MTTEGTARPPEGTPTPVVFVHGLWLHADSWGPWVERYAAAGYDAHAPGWPGDGPTVEETRANPDAVGGYGIDRQVLVELRPVGEEPGADLVERLDRDAVRVVLGAEQFYGGNRDGSALTQGVRDQFWRLSMQAGLKAAYDCVEQFSETDFTADLRSIDVPVLVVHGDDDQMVPIGPSALRTVELLPDATLVVHEGRPHGLFGDYETEFDEDLLAFLRA